MCQNCCTLHICPDLKYMTSLTKYTVYEVAYFVRRSTSPSAEQVLPAKVIFSFTLLPQIRQNNEDLRNLACDIVL
jgi:hypothetical protein